MNRQQDRRGMVIAAHRVKNGQNSTQKKQHFFMYFRILISVSAFIALLPYDGCGGKVGVCIIVSCGASPLRKNVRKLFAWLSFSLVLLLHFACLFFVFSLLANCLANKHHFVYNVIVVAHKLRIAITLRLQLLKYVSVTCSHIR